MNKEDILRLAEERSRCAETVRYLGMQNAYGQTPEQAVASSARFRLANDALIKANQEYALAVASLSVAELSELARS